MESDYEIGCGRNISPSIEIILTFSHAEQLMTPDINK